MAMIHVNRSGTSLGVFSEDDVRAGLRSGRFLPTDLGWREGMPQWQPLSQFTEFAADLPSMAAGAPPPPTPPPTTSPVPAAAIATTAATVPRSGLPWDNRSSRGFLPAFFDTLVMVLTRPGEAFTAMKREGGFSEPLLYALVGGFCGCAVWLLFAMLMPSMAMFGDRHNALLGGFLGMGLGLFLNLILIPVVLIVSLFVGAAILHVCLMIVGGAKQSYETTFRVVCFSMGSTYPLFILPVCGSFIAFVWNLIVECIGIARAHETDIGRAVLAVFLPLIICCGFAFIGSLFLSGLIHQLNH